MATASCRRSISTWRWSGCPIPRAIASRSRCRANSCHTNITAPAATCRNMDLKRDRGEWRIGSSEWTILPLAIRHSLLALLDLRDRDRRQFIHLAANLRFADRNALGGKVAGHLADDAGVA